MRARAMSMSILRISSMLSLCLYVSVVSFSFADWPLFRGNPQQTGVAASKLPDKLQILWTFRTKDAIEGTPAIASGTAYIGSYDDNVYALDLVTGQEKWRNPTDEATTPVAFH